MAGRGEAAEPAGPGNPTGAPECVEMLVPNSWKDGGTALKGALSKEESPVWRGRVLAGFLERLGPPPVGLLERNGVTQSDRLWAACRAPQFSQVLDIPEEIGKEAHWIVPRIEAGDEDSLGELSFSRIVGWAGAAETQALAYPILEYLINVGPDKVRGRLVYQLRREAWATPLLEPLLHDPSEFVALMSLDTLARCLPREWAREVLQGLSEHDSRREVRRTAGTFLHWLQEEERREAAS